MGLAEEVRARYREAARLGVHPCRERLEVSELGAHGERGDIEERVEDGERRAGVVDDLVCEETREGGVERA